MNLDSPETRYALLRTALDMFQQPPAELDAAQTRQLQQRVNGELAIGSRLLRQRDSREVTIPDSRIETALCSLLDGFDSEASFDETLAYNGLTRQSLRQALRYELSVEAILEQIMDDNATVSESEAEIYYLQHQDKFTVPETRTASHILITINDEYPDNRRDKVVARMQVLHEQCAGSGARLKELALRYSECPSAMKEGVIGRVKPGQLYPQLDALLFNMEEGDISEVVESEVGLHIMHCEAIHSAERLPFEQIKEKVMAHLEQKKRALVLRNTLSS